MVRPFLPPLNDEDLETYLSLPKFDGHVVNPEYVQPGARKDNLERDLKAWCDLRSPAIWPQWVYEWHCKFEFKQTAERRRAGEHLVRSDAGERVEVGRGVPAVPAGRDRLGPEPDPVIA